MKILRSFQSLYLYIKNKGGESNELKSARIVMENGIICFFISSIAMKLKSARIVMEIQDTT
ncbi:hypothetical protein Metvu_0955 [Methanocaldococcus vulcanius M7]|uniref:Uncharacterized protein n=1 Tax=Methanocaldococcus vulcanius (strain ATCC 700851 / DSM 12094 / M7) TaxID=579137 RepID=C9RGW1_METVM|nr:hypothetical protein [Methanocaldococcus vulcanius]ACX72813.1 hypothetical protein Metvu_0955 [Methanocaldococcus vulcanius M7]